MDSQSLAVSHFIHSSEHRSLWRTLQWEALADDVTADSTVFHFFSPSKKFRFILAFVTSVKHTTSPVMHEQPTVSLKRNFNCVLFTESGTLKLTTLVKIVILSSMWLRPYLAHCVSGRTMHLKGGKERPICCVNKGHK